MTPFLINALFHNILAQIRLLENKQTHFPCGLGLYSCFEFSVFKTCTLNINNKLSLNTEKLMYFIVYTVNGTSSF